MFRCYSYTIIRDRINDESALINALPDDDDDDDDDDGAH